MATELSAQWQKHHEELKAKARALIVDGEQASSSLLEQLLRGEGYGADLASSISEAWSRIEARQYDLVIAESNLTDGSGLDLMVKMLEAGIDTPSVLSTAFPSVASMSKAMGMGAADYLTKPFPDLSRLAARLTSLLDQRFTERLHERISADLASVMKSRSTDSESLARIGKRLFEFKTALKERHSTILIEASAGMAELAQNALTAAQISSEAVTGLNVAEERLLDPSGPLTAVVSLKLSGALEFIEKTQEENPLIEIVATTTSPSMETALAAVDAGAADVFSRSHESIDALQARVKRAVKRSRRQRLFINLVQTLWQETDPSEMDEESVLSLVPPAQRHLITRVERRSTGTVKECSREPTSDGGDLPLREEAPLVEEASLDEEAQPRMNEEPQLEGDAAQDISFHQQQEVQPHPTGDAPQDLSFHQQHEEQPHLTDDTGQDLSFYQQHEEQPHLTDDTGQDLSFYQQQEEQHDPAEPYAPQQGYERRREPRYPCSILVQLRPWGTSSTLLPCQLRDLSLGGMFIHIPVPPPLGTRFEIQIDAESFALECEPICLVAEVVRSMKIEPDPDQQTGVGVRLLQAPPELSLLAERIAASCAY